MDELASDYRKQAHGPLILFAGADSPMRRKILGYLDSGGLRTENTPTVDDALAILLKTNFDLILLDLTDPDQLSTCVEIRNLMPTAKIVGLKAGGALEDEIAILDSGADDCLRSPFRFRKLIARLNAVMRSNRIEAEMHDAVLHAGELELDTESRIFRRGGHTVHLSNREFDLLRYFLEHQEAPVTHTQLLRAAWGRRFRCVHVPSHLRSYVKLLRKKVEKNASRPVHILTEPWVGYRFHNPAHS